MPAPSQRLTAPRLTAPLLFGATLAASVLYACVTDRDVPIHGWWSERGPVVRHDTFPADCSLCHEGSTWTELVEGFEWDHEAETGYALVGAHAEAKCLRCHNDRGPVQIFERQGCGGCHEDVHRGLLGAGCQDCHGESDWQAQGPIAEHRRTRFPLTGAHLVTPCWRCHQGAERGEFSLEDVRCEACHQEDLAQAVDPDHHALGWEQDCERCHLPTTWDGAGFRHFALLSGCESCHLDDYRSATQPIHTPDAFPLGCQWCHYNDAWQPAELDHPFPRVLIHELFTCDQCHLRTRDFSSFSCIHCHWHEEGNEEFRHKGVRGYVWEDRACVDCHPTGH